MSEHYTCPGCNGRVSVPSRATLQSVQAVHDETCPRRKVRSS